MSDEQKPVAFDALYAALDPKEQRFVDEYLECVNATLAARRVWGGKAAKQKGYVLTRRPDVAAAIEAGLREQRERTNNDPDRIIRELMLIAFADPRDLVDARGNLLPVSKLAHEVRRVIASIDVEHEKVTTRDIIPGEEGQVATSKQRVTTTTRVLRYRLAPKTPALELLGRRLKMFTDRLELDASDNLASLIAKAYGRPFPAASSEPSA